MPITLFINFCLVIQALLYFTCMLENQLCCSPVYRFSAPVPMCSCVCTCVLSTRSGGHTNTLCFLQCFNCAAQPINPQVLGGVHLPMWEPPWGKGIIYEWTGNTALFSKQVEHPPSQQGQLMRQRLMNSFHASLLHLCPPAHHAISISLCRSLSLSLNTHTHTHSPLSPHCEIDSCESI